MFGAPIRGCRLFFNALPFLPFLAFFGFFFKGLEIVTRNQALMVQSSDDAWLSAEVQALTSGFTLSQRPDSLIWV